MNSGEKRERVDWSVAPEGWNPLDEPPEDGDEVEGLLSNGRTTDAEWWGPVPEELWDASGDGSGWAFAGNFDFSQDVELIAWRQHPPGTVAIREALAALAETPG